MNWELKDWYEYNVQFKKITFYLMKLENDNFPFENCDQGSFCGRFIMWLVIVVSFWLLFWITVGLQAIGLTNQFKLLLALPFLYKFFKLSPSENSTTYFCTPVLGSFWGK